MFLWFTSYLLTEVTSRTPWTPVRSQGGREPNFSPSHLSQQSSTVKSFRIPIIYLRVLFVGFLSILFLFYWKGILTETFYVSHSQQWDYIHQYHCKRGFHDLYSQWQHRSWTYTWFLAVEQAVDMTPGVPVWTESVQAPGSRLLHTSLRVLSYPPKLSPTPTPFIISSLPTCSSVAPCFPLLHHVFVHWSGIGNLFIHAQVAVHENTHRNESLVCFKISGFWNRIKIIVDTPLGHYLSRYGVRGRIFIRFRPRHTCSWCWPLAMMPLCLQPVGSTWAWLSCFQ